MAETSAIEWTDATCLFGGPLPRRCTKCRALKSASEFKIDRSRADGISFVCRACSYVRVCTSSPGQTERRQRAITGEKWCGHCQAWRAADDVGKNGLCRDGEAAYARHLYHEQEAVRFRRKQRSIARKRGVAPIPHFAAGYLLDEFEGECAYCGSPAQAWDHVVPVSAGGQTVPHNIVPACHRCNSSKRDREVFAWLENTSRVPKDRFFDRLDLEDLHG